MSSEAPATEPNEPASTTAVEPPRGRHDRAVSIIEAILLAVVALLAAWSGYSSARWSTDSRLDMGKASAARTEATRAALEADEIRDLDSSTFDAWFTAFVADDADAMQIAEHRFRPEFDAAFEAWLATNPQTNPDAPPGPTAMPEYVQPQKEESKRLDATAESLSASATDAAGNADDYVRITVILASVLFLVGISGHFRIKSARVGLIVVAATILTYSIVLLAAAPRAPG